MTSRLPLPARRVFRLALTTALALALAYGLQVPMPHLVPVLTLVLASSPAPPVGLKGLLVLLLVVLLTLGLGLLLPPLLIHYALAGVLLVGIGLYFSTYLTVHRGKVMVGTLLTIGVTLISAAGTQSTALATLVIYCLGLGLVISIVCQWLVYPWFPEDGLAGKKAAVPLASRVQAHWIALRGALIVLPVYLLALINPGAYLPIIMKSVSLGQQSSLVNAKNAGRELLGSTFLAGCFALGFWVLLDLVTTLWMFFWLMLLFGIYFASKINRVIPSRFSASFWLNVAQTMLLLLGPAVQDSESGKDVVAAFVERMGLFVAVTLYAWMAVYWLEYWRTGIADRNRSNERKLEMTTC